jgi:hypothetical protein
MAYWTHVQVKTVSCNELFYFTQTVSVYQTHFYGSWKWVDRTFPRQCRCNPRQCPGATVIPAIYDSSTKLNCYTCYISQTCQTRLSYWLYMTDLPNSTVIPAIYITDLPNSTGIPAIYDRPAKLNCYTCYISQTCQTRLSYRLYMTDLPN